LHDRDLTGGGPAQTLEPDFQRVFDRFDGALTVGGGERLLDDPADGPEVQGPIEEAVLDLIDRRESPALERVG
jgi:hypothetical protein